MEPDISIPALVRSALSVKVTWRVCPCSVSRGRGVGPDEARGGHRGERDGAAEHQGARRVGGGIHDPPAELGVALALIAPDRRHLHGEAASCHGAAADRELAGDVAGPADGDVVLPEQDLFDAVPDDRPGGHAPCPGDRPGGGGFAPGRRGAASTRCRGLQAQLRRSRPGNEMDIDERAAQHHRDSEDHRSSEPQRPAPRGARDHDRTPFGAASAAVGCAPLVPADIAS